MKRILLIAAVAAASILMFSCGGSTGTVTLNLTDAPVDSDEIKSVFITVTGIGYHEEDTDTWTDINFDEAKKYDLLSLTNGTKEMLGEFDLPAGRITQLRFYLDAKETGQSTPASPGCYVVKTDDSEHDLFVPSGGSSGYKATGSFDVPSNGEIVITADFDVRKSLKETSGTYNLRPTIRLIVDGEAGSIEGSVVYGGTNSLVVFVYEDDEYEDSEATADSAGDYFMNAVSSAVIDAESNYILPFLAAGTYDLVFAEFNAVGEYVTDTVKFSEDVTVESGETTTRDFDTTN